MFEDLVHVAGDKRADGSQYCVRCCERVRAPGFAVKTGSLVRGSKVVGNYPASVQGIDCEPVAELDDDDLAGVTGERQIAAIH